MLYLIIVFTKIDCSWKLLFDFDVKRIFPELLILFFFLFGKVRRTMAQLDFYLFSFLFLALFYFAFLLYKK